MYPKLLNCFHGIKSTPLDDFAQGLPTDYLISFQPERKSVHETGRPAEFIAEKYEKRVSPYKDYVFRKS